MAFKFYRQTENLFLTLSGAGATQLVCIGARVREKLSTISELRMEFYSNDTTFNPADILGKTITLEAGNGFKFSGLVIMVEDLGNEDSGDLFAAEIRPWPWLLTIGADNRVFQAKTTIEIVKDVFQAAGFTDVTDSTTGSYAAREYCVQYGESNFDFISRLLEEEGIYYFFDHSGQVEKIVLGDGISAHTDGGTVDFTKSNQIGDKNADANSIFEWAEIGKVVTGKVSLFDYDMTLPNADLKVQQAIASGSHGHVAVERYHDGGHYKVAEDGEALAKKEMEGHAADFARAKGTTNSAVLRSGGLFTLNHEVRDAVNAAYLVVGCTHYMQFDAGYKENTGDSYNRHVEKIEFPEAMELYETEFEVQKSSVQFRPPRITEWPEVPSLLTAEVTGPSGEEIYTDPYGRIKVMFPWDRLGKGDDTTSCWVRSVLPWTGKDWGWQSIPRIGMEVIIQFERGNIDRPYCTGMIYNGVNSPPYALPGMMTKTGIRTNSSKGGGGFHELTFDDKKDSESIFFQSEKDYKQVIKNNAEITIGMEKQKDGNLTQTIYKNKTETIKTGDLTLTVEEGNRITKIKTDDTTTIEGKSTATITGDTSVEIKTGNLTEKVGSGNMSTEVSTGNQDTQVKLGNISIKAAAGAISIEAMQSIELKVGSNSVKIDMTGVTIKGTMIQVTGDAMAKIGAPMTQVSGDGMLTLKGGIVMVN